MGLDETDQGILRLLRTDGRMANREIASRLSLNEATVRNRLRRFSAEDLVRVVAVADFSMFAFDFMMLVGVDVRGRPVERVAQELAQLPSVLSCNIVVGRHDIQMIVAEENRATAMDLISQKIGKTNGVHRVRVSIMADVLKYQVDTSGPSPRGALEAFHTAGNDLPASVRLDATDLDILRHLWRDARESNQQIANELGVVEGTVRGRIKKMIDDRAIRIQAISNMDNVAQPAPILAFLGMHVDPKYVSRVADKLSELRETGFVATMMGEFEVAVLIFAEDRNRLADLFLGHIRAMPGVHEIEASFPIQFAKFDFRFGRVGSR